MMRKQTSFAGLAAAALVAIGGGPVGAETFNRIASFPVAENLPEDVDPATETAPEIIDATDDGMMLYYTDSPVGAVGMVDISDPASPQPGGVIMLEGEPTSLAVHGGAAYVAINTSQSFTEPSGRVSLIVLEEGEPSDFCELGGQPDAIAIAPDGTFLAVAIENERDEDLNDGVIPQLPPGNVTIIPLQTESGALLCQEMIVADLTGLAEVAPSDPEPEFVDINENGEIVVTLQENNHIVVLNPDGTVKSDFSAGSVFLQNADVDEEGALLFATDLDRKREPDAVKWLDPQHVVTANEGDYEGGSRGFTIFDVGGSVAFESGLTFEYALASIGHYPEERSGNKGVEPEGLAVGTYGETQYIFVLSERGSAVGVYEDTGDRPILAGLLPSGIGPEGAVAIPSRNLFVTANEADLREDGGPGAHVMIYELQDGEPSYPTISARAGETAPIGWGALSGLAADPSEPATLYAVNDSFYAMQPQIFVIDAGLVPAEIVAAIPVTRARMPAQKLDLEGIVADGEGGFWLASEGRADRLIPHALYHVAATGGIDQEIAFPDELLAVQRRFGAEGITKIGDRLWIAIQREWGDDPDGHVKLVSYDLQSEEWGAVHYPLEEAETGWVGLSEITAADDFVYIVERDNQIGAAAKVKQLTRVALSELEPAPLGGELPVVQKEVVRDFIPDLAAYNGYVVDKVEGFAIDAAGEGFVVTDNDGTDDSSGETFFFSIGEVATQ